MSRRGLTDRRLFWVIALVPLLGVAAYITLRPPIAATQPQLDPKPDPVPPPAKL